MAKRMHDSGLYAESANLRSIRQSIQSYLYRIEHDKKYSYKVTGYFGWHNWCRENNWDAYSGLSRPLN